MSILARRPDQVNKALKFGAGGWAVVGLEGAVELWADEDEAILGASRLNDISEKHGLRCPYWTAPVGKCPGNFTDRDDEHRLFECSLVFGHEGAHEADGAAWTDATTVYDKAGEDA